MGAWTLGEKYALPFREIRTALDSESLDRAICDYWERNDLERCLKVISSGLMAPSDLPCSFGFLMDPLYYCRFLGVALDLERYTWGDFLPRPEQGVRFLEELSLYQAGKNPVCSTGLPWLFQSNAAPRREASVEQKRTLFRLFDVTEQTAFAEQYLCPPEGCIYPRIRLGKAYGNGRLVTLTIPLPEGMELRAMPGQTCHLTLPDGSAAVLTLRAEQNDRVDELSASGYVEHYTPRDVPTRFKVWQHVTASQAAIGWLVTHDDADGLFCLSDPTLPHWAPFMAWFEKERRGLLEGSAQTLSRKGEALMDELSSIAAEG